MSKIRIGMIGCGQIAQFHMSEYAKIENAEMVAFADIKRDAAAASSVAYGGGTVYTDFRELLKRDDIDAVDVCLHNNYHMPVTVEALQAGKHVYCEKPMAGSYRDAVTMLDTAKSVGRRVHIQLSTLFDDSTRAAKELIEIGELGDVYHARSTGFRRRGRPYVDGYGTPTFVQKRNSAGGALYDMGVYHISQCLYLLGCPKVERISGKTYQRIEIDQARAESSGYDVEELGLGFVRLENDLSLDIIESWAAMMDGFEGSYILGSKGGIRLDPFRFCKNLGNVEIDATANLAAARYRWDNVVGDGDVFGNSQAHWVAALQGRVKPLPTAQIALDTMLVSEGIYLSQQLQREVTADEVLEMSVSTAIVV